MGTHQLRAALVLGMSVPVVSTVLSAQEAGSPDEIRVGPNVHVSADRAGDVIVEASVAVNPADPSNVLVGAMTIEEGESRAGPGEADGRRSESAWRTTLFVSRDAGESWRVSDPVGERGWAHSGDPWVAFGPEGEAYFATLVSDSSFVGSGRSAFAVFRSDDGGATWSRPLLAPAGDPPAFYDHVVLDVDRSDGPRRGSLYAGVTSAWRNEDGWAIQAPTVLRSDDGARTFSGYWKRPETNLLGGLRDLKVRTDGTVVALFGDGGLKGDKRGGRVEFGYSPRKVVFLSRDGARTFSVGYVVTNAATTGGWTDMAVDRSDGPLRDRIYYAWAHSVPGEFGVHVVHSDDGHAWSKPVRVAPEDADTWVRVAAAAVNGRGVLGVLWHQRVPGTDPAEQHTWFAASWDGGKTFSEPVRVSSAPSTPASGPHAARFPAGGDYVGLAGSPHGSFHAAWGDARDGTFQIYGARIEVSGRAEGAVD